MAKTFASTGDMAEKKITFAEIGRDLYAFTAEGDPNSGVIVGDDGVIVIDAQATPVMAQLVIDRVRQVTDKPIKYVVLSHYHAVRVLGASAYKAQEVIASDKCRAMIAERGKEDWDSEYGRFPRLFRAAETIPGLTWPTVTFKERMTLYLGKRRVELQHSSAAPIPPATSSPTCRTPTWSSPATSSSTSRPATAATRISRIGPPRSPASIASRPTRWCRAAAMRWSASTRWPRASRSPATSCATSTSP